MCVYRYVGVYVCAYILYSVYLDKTNKDYHFGSLLQWILF